MAEAGEPQAAQQFGLKYLFFVTTSVAVGAWLVSHGGFHPAVRLLGLSIIEFWIAKCFFVVSLRLPELLRVIVFLMGLLFYLACVSTVMWVLLAFFAELMKFFAT